MDMKIEFTQNLKDKLVAFTNGVDIPGIESRIVGEM